MQYNRNMKKYVKRKKPLSLRAYDTAAEGLSGNRSIGAKQKPEQAHTSKLYMIGVAVLMHGSAIGGGIAATRQARLVQPLIRLRKSI